jgi:cobalamin-dependent methionine synthase I
MWRVRWSGRASSCRCLSAERRRAVAHTAVKIAPHYSEPVVHVLDASRAVPVTTSLLSDDGKAAFVAKKHRADYEAIRKAHSAPRQPLSCRSRGPQARELRSSGALKTLPVPEFTGVRVLDNFPLATLREYIDWSPFFHTWGLKGIYPRILEDGSARERRRASSSPMPTRCSIASSKKLDHGARRLRLLPCECGRRRC